MPNTHPSSDLLLDYASGALPLAPGLTVHAHLSACEDCRADVALLEDIGGALVDALPETALETGALARALIARTEARPEGDAAPTPNRYADVDLPRAVLMAGLGRRQWLGPGGWFVRSKAAQVDGWRTFLICLPADGRLPAHTHGGSELVCVLKGSFNDGETWLKAGDFAQSDGTVSHDVTVSSEGPCVCLISTKARLRWKGWAKVLTPVFGL